VWKQLKDATLKGGATPQAQKNQRRGSISGIKREVDRREISSDG
jgi:hypothetical protein